VTNELVLEMRGIRKEFPGIVANDDVDLDVRRGEVHALLGENGAGKSTLMNILYGLYRPDAGEILVHGKRMSFSSAKDAIEAGIGMVHQHFMLIPVMTSPRTSCSDGAGPRGDSARRACCGPPRPELAKSFNFEIDPDPGSTASPSASSSASRS